MLERERLLVLFDDFEQNLTPNEGEFLDPGFAEIIEWMLDAAQTGRLLLTCRYPIPNADLLLRVDLPALSPGELRRLFLRLPALRAFPPEDRRLINHAIGSHSRLIEFVDVLLRDSGEPERREPAVPTVVEAVGVGEPVVLLGQQHDGHLPSAVSKGDVPSSWLTREGRTWRTSIFHS